jgi:hypothetical protein
MIAAANNRRIALRWRDVVKQPAARAECSAGRTLIRPQHHFASRREALCEVGDAIFGQHDRIGRGG